MPGFLPPKEAQAQGFHLPALGKSDAHDPVGGVLDTLGGIGNVITGAGIKTPATDAFFGPILGGLSVGHDLAGGKPVQALFDGVGTVLSGMVPASWGAGPALLPGLIADGNGYSQDHDWWGTGGDGKPRDSLQWSQDTSQQTTGSVAQTFGTAAGSAAAGPIGLGTLGIGLVGDLVGGIAHQTQVIGNMIPGLAAQPGTIGAANQGQTLPDLAGDAIGTVATTAGQQIGAGLANAENTVGAVANTASNVVNGGIGCAQSLLSAW